MTKQTALPVTVNHIKGLDGLRALAAMSVVVYHVGVFAPPGKGSLVAQVAGIGWVGVDVFFAISGFILFLPFQRSATGGAPVQLKRYAASRLRRVLPAYLLNIFALTTLTAATLLVHPQGLVILAANLTFTAGYFGLPSVNGVYWTLFCEMAFYLLLPVLALIFVRRRWRLGLPAVIILAVGFKAAAISELASPTDKTPLRHALEQFPGVIDQFAMGMVAAVVWVALERRGVVLHKLLGAALALGGFAGIVGILYVLQVVVGAPAYWAGSSNAGWLPLITFKPLISLCAGMTIIGVGFSENAVTRALELRPLRYLGTISFGIYLWHLPLAKLIAAELPRSPRTLRLYILCLVSVTVLAVGWAAVSHRFVERPFLRRGNRPPVLDEDVAPPTHATEPAPRIRPTQEIEPTPRPGSEPERQVTATVIR